MRKRHTPVVDRQEVHWVPKDRRVPLSEKPYRVWTLYEHDESSRPELPMTPRHNVNAFLEDQIHDWNYVQGKLVYYSRVTHSEVWILVEYETPKETT